MDQFAEEVCTRVPPLTAAGKLAFAYAICVRLQPHYHAFFAAEAWGDPAAIQAALVTLHQVIFRPPAVADLPTIYRKVEDVTPDSDDFGSNLGSFALDTCCALLAALDFVREQADQQVVDVAMFARNTVDLYVQELEDLDPMDPELEQKIEGNYYSVQEVRWQRAALTRLAGIERPTQQLLDELTQGQMLDLERLPE